MKVREIVDTRMKWRMSGTPVRSKARLLPNSKLLISRHQRTIQSVVSVRVPHNRCAVSVQAFQLQRAPIAGVWKSESTWTYNALAVELPGSSVTGVLVESRQILCNGEGSIQTPLKVVRGASLATITDRAALRPKSLKTSRFEALGRKGVGKSGSAYLSVG